MGETFLSLQAPRSPSSPPCEPSVQGGPGAPGVNAGPRPWTEGHGGQAHTGVGFSVSGRPEEVCGLALGAVEDRMPLRDRRMDSEGLTGLGWHWSAPRRFEDV